MMINNYSSHSENMTNEDMQQAILNDDYDDLQCVIPDTSAKLRSEAEDYKSETENSY
jgi:hypothetical protein